MTLALLLAAAVLLAPGRGLPRVGPSRARPGRSRPAKDHPADAAALSELFAAALESGLAPAEATRWCADGEPVEEPVAWWSGRVPTVARALAVAERLGSPAADAVRAAAEAERTRTQLERDLRSGLAGVRATAWLLTALPVLGAVGARLLAPAPESAALVVAAATAGGAAATLGGWWWLRVLVGGARRKALA